MLQKVDNIEVKYDYKYVSKRTLVFLHGFGGNLCNFGSISNTFFNFGFSTLNINLTDYGFKHLPNSFTIYDYANVVYLLIKKLKIKECILIGHSFGGRISIILSSMYNSENIIKKLVLVDSAGLKKRFNFVTKLKIIKYKFYKFLYKKAILTKEKLDSFGSDDYKSISDDFKPIFNNIVNEDLKFLLKNINLQTLIIFGKKDKITPLYFGKVFNNNIKNSELIVLNGAHFAYLENKQIFINILKNFIMKDMEKK